MSLLSVDILHQVFKFFVSKNQTIDGDSLRVASLVCKQWKGVVDSRSLWATPARIKERDVNGGNDNDDCQFCTVHQSLRIKEEIDDSLSNGKSLQESLMGFVKLKCYGGKDPELHFFVRERATGSKWLLSISRDGQKPPSLIRDIYVNHFELKDKFLLQDQNSSEIFFPSFLGSKGKSKMAHGVKLPQFLSDDTLNLAQAPFGFAHCALSRPQS